MSLICPGADYQAVDEASTVGELAVLLPQSVSTILEKRLEAESRPRSTVLSIEAEADITSRRIRESVILNPVSAGYISGLFQTALSRSSLSSEVTALMSDICEESRRAAALGMKFLPLVVAGANICE